MACQPFTQYSVGHLAPAYCMICAKKENDVKLLTVSAEQGFANSRRIKLPNGGEFVRSVFIGTQDKPANPDHINRSFIRSSRCRKRPSIRITTSSSNGR